MQTGGASGTLNNVAPSATSGIPLISQGASSQSVFGTAVVAGGGTGVGSFTAYAPIVGGTTTTGNLQSASTGMTNIGYVFTSTGASVPTWQALPSGGTTTIDGDTGSATPSSGTIKFDANTNSGSSVTFQASGSTVNLSVTDSNSNIIIGQGSGNGLISGLRNVGLGTTQLSALTSGSQNVALGDDALISMTSGSYNLAVGYAAGYDYNGSEHDNILLNAWGTTGESNVFRVGNGTGTGNQEINAVYINGVSGATPTSANTPQVTLCDNTGNLTTISSGTSGYVLTSNGSATPSFQAAAGGSSPLTLIATKTATAATSLTFTSGISSTYNNYLLLASNIINPLFGGNFFGIRISTNGGSSYINSGYSAQYSSSTVLPLFNPSSTTTTDFTANLNNFTSGAGYVGITCFSSIFDSSVPGGNGNTVGGTYNTALTTVNALQLVADDGSAFSGTFSLYGYSK